MQLSLDEALRRGIAYHRAGNVQEAERLYRSILQAHPQHPDANHNLGVLATGVGKVEAAIPFFKTALEANPKIEQFWLSYIEALIKLNQIADAKAVLDQARSKGAKGDGFDQLEKKLESSSSLNSDTEEPSQKQLQNLINQYSQGQYQETLN